MVYKSNFVAVVKTNGTILREKGESNDEVYLPFGNEYSLLLKNKNSKRVQVKVQIDGVDVLGGNSLVLEPNSSPGSEMELERFIDNNNMCQGNKFKFIQKTQQIAEHLGDKIDDGFITITYQFEAEKPEIKDVITHRYNWYHDPYPWSIYHPPIYFGSSILRDVSYSSELSANIGSSIGSSDNIVATASCSVQDSTNKMKYTDSIKTPRIDRTITDDSIKPEINPDEGITVRGDISNQQFRTTFMGKLEENSYTINIRLKGTKSNGTTINRPITIKTKLECKTCGTKLNSNVKFCSNCGTFLNY